MINKPDKYDKSQYRYLGLQLFQVLKVDLIIKTAYVEKALFYTLAN